MHWEESKGPWKIYVKSKVGWDSDNDNIVDNGAVQSLVGYVSMCLVWRWVGSILIFLGWVQPT